MYVQTIRQLKMNKAAIVFFFIFQYTFSRGSGGKEHLRNGFNG